MNIADNLTFGCVDRAPYQLMHLLRELPSGFSSFTPVSKTDLTKLKEIRNHAQNANDTLIHGLGAIGHILMTAGLNAEGAVEPSHLARLGNLITHMAVEIEGLQELDWTIRDIETAMLSQSGKDGEKAATKV